MNRRKFLTFFSGAVATAVLFPKVAMATKTMEVVIHYDLRNGYNPTSQYLLFNGKNWKVTSSRDTIFTTEIVAEGLVKRSGDFKLLKLNRQSSAFPSPVKIGGYGKTSAWFPLHDYSRVTGFEQGDYVAIHDLVGDGNDNVGSLLCFRVFGFESFLQEITTLQKQGIDITWRIEHLL